MVVVAAWHGGGKNGHMLRDLKLHNAAPPGGFNVLMIVREPNLENAQHFLNKLPEMMRCRQNNSSIR
jgi:hypothetical protein